LINTFLLLASLALAAWSSGQETQPARNRNDRTFSLAAAGPLIALVLVAVAGVITALGDTLFPSHTLVEGMRDDFSSTASFLIRLRIIHPFLAVGAGFVVALVGCALYPAGFWRFSPPNSPSEPRVSCCRLLCPSNSFTCF